MILPLVTGLKRLAATALGRALHAHPKIAKVAGEALGRSETDAVRRAVAHLFLKGSGVEVGAGDRPFPLPDGVRCHYGDVLNETGLKDYFAGADVAFSGHLDAQTFAGVADESFDFVISAHVLEHLADPLGAIESALRVLKVGGVMILVVPDMRFTWDRARPVTPLEHLVADHRDGGEGTLLDSYREHVRYLHPQWAPPIPEDRVEAEAERMRAGRADTHLHTWTTESLRAMLDHAAGVMPLQVVGGVQVANENLFVLRKTPAALTTPADGA